MIKRKIWIGAFVLLISLAGILSTVPAHAFLGLFEKKEFREDETQKSLTESIVDEESFKKNTKMFADIPYNDTSMEYEIYLPNDWEGVGSSNNSDDTININRKLLGTVGAYQGPIIGSSRPVVTIYAVELEHEILASDWLENFILNTGAALQAPLDAISPKMAKASYIAFNGLLATDNLTKVLIYGNTALVVQVSSSLSVKSQFSFVQEKIINSFKLRTPKEGGIETLKTFTIGDALKFSYPDSWKIAYPDFKNSLRLSMQLQNQNSAGKMDGIIQFWTIARSSDTNIKLEIQRLKDFLVKNYKLNIVAMTSSGNAPVYSRFNFARQEVYSIGADKSAPPAKEIWLAALGDKDWYTFIYLITPTRTNSLYTWARNTRAFDLILQSLK